MSFEYITAVKEKDSFSFSRRNAEKKLFNFFLKNKIAGNCGEKKNLDEVLAVFGTAQEQNCFLIDRNIHMHNRINYSNSGKITSDFIKIQYEYSFSRFFFRSSIFTHNLLVCFYFCFVLLPLIYSCDEYSRFDGELIQRCCHNPTTSLCEWPTRAYVVWYAIRLLKLSRVRWLSCLSGSDTYARAQRWNPTIR